MMARRTLIQAGVAAGTLASAVGIAMAATNPPAPAPADPARRAATPVAAVDARQLAMLGVLRRPLAPGDDLPASAKAMIADGSGPDLGANPALARLALTTSLGEKLYVVPAQGWVCLTSSAGTGGCTPTDQVGEGYGVGLSGIPSGYRVAGLVPDGVSRVVVRGPTETATATATPANNAWQVDVTFEPTAVAWTGPAGEKIVPVHVPPASDGAPPVGANAAGLMSAPGR